MKIAMINNDAGDHVYGHVDGHNDIQSVGHVVGHGDVDEVCHDDTFGNDFTRKEVNVECRKQKVEISLRKREIILSKVFSDMRRQAPPRG